MKTVNVFTQRTNTWEKSTTKKNSTRGRNKKQNKTKKGKTPDQNLNNNLIFLIYTYFLSMALTDVSMDFRVWPSWYRNWVTKENLILLVKKMFFLTLDVNLWSECLLRVLQKKSVWSWLQMLSANWFQFLLDVNSELAIINCVSKGCSILHTN